MSGGVVRSAAWVSLAVLGLAAGGCKPRGQVSQTSASASASAVPAATSDLRWELDERFSYDLELRTVTANGRSPVPLFITLQGRLEVSFAKAGKVVHGLIQIRDPQLVDHAKRPLHGAEQLVDELARPFGIELGGGELTAYYEPEGATVQTTGFRRQIVALLQLPPETKAATHVTEWDPTGLASIEYRPGEDGTVDWKKLGYERVVLRQARRDDSVSADEVKPRIAESQGRTRVDEHGLVELTRREELELPLTQGNDISTSVTVKLKRRGHASTQKPSASPPGLFVATRRVAVGEAVDPSKQANWDEVMVGGRSFSDVITELERLVAKGDPSASERGELFRALIGLFRLHGETVDLAKKVIVAKSPLADLLVDALGMASTVSSLTTLGALAYDARVPKARQRRAASSLVRAPHPNRAGLEACIKMIDSSMFREHGLLGTGTFTRLLREAGDIELARLGSDRLAKELSAEGGDPTDRVLVLLSVANSGDPRLFESVLPVQDAKDERVRQAAIQAIRLMDDQRVEPRLYELLARKDKGDVSAALQALGRREVASEATVRLALQLAKDHNDGPLRRDAVLALVKWREKWPQVEPTIKDRHDNDPDKRVRQAAYVRD